MDNKNQEQLINDMEYRHSFVDRVNVLDKIKKLITLPNTEILTAKMVSDYYEIDFKTLEKCMQRNKKELSENGLAYKTYKDLASLMGNLKSDIMSELKISRRGSNIFTKRAVLNIGMLLRDSKVAQEVRRLLLDHMEDTQEQLTINIETENELLLKVIQSENELDMALALNKYRTYINRHIQNIDGALQGQSKLTQSKIKLMNQALLGGCFNVKIGSKTVGKLLKVIGIAKKSCKNTKPYDDKVPQYADTYIDQNTGSECYKWNYNECVKRIDEWLKENWYYEKFYQITNREELRSFINKLYFQHVIAKAEEVVS
ncbi:MAG: hypothetical protein GY714_23425 [Desulfobacterales bacterium]|nr:hypothetical protein [Desulfobacterales bacterium]